MHDVHRSACRGVRLSSLTTKPTSAAASATNSTRGMPISAMARSAICAPTRAASGSSPMSRGRAADPIASLPRSSGAGRCACPASAAARWPSIASTSPRCSSKRCATRRARSSPPTRSAARSPSGSTGCGAGRASRSGRPRNRLPHRRGAAARAAPRARAAGRTGAEERRLRRRPRLPVRARPLDRQICAARRPADRPIAGRLSAPASSPLPDDPDALHLLMHQILATGRCRWREK